MKPKCTFLMHISVLIVKDSVHIMPKINIILPVCFLKWVNRIKLTSAQIMCVWAVHKSQLFPLFFLCFFFLLIFSFIMCWCITSLGTGLVWRALWLSYSFPFACVTMMTHGRLLNSQWMQQLCVWAHVCVFCYFYFINSV